jgi:tetratricopeptide (TPR) repeat protein
MVLLNEVQRAQFAPNMEKYRYSNLPQPPYRHFIERPNVVSLINTALGSSLAVVLVTSLGGMGKTSICHKVASLSLKNKSNKSPNFKAIVWVSDFQREGRTNLSQVLDTIAETLNWRPLKFEYFAEKIIGVNRLLKSIPSLIIIDDYETTQDSSILDWSMSVPSPSKVLIISREDISSIRHNFEHIKIPPMSEDEALELLKEQPQIKQYNPRIDTNKLKELIKISGKNPKAIELIAGYLRKYKINSIIEELKLSHFHDPNWELFEFVLAKSWGELNDNEKDILIVSTFFDSSASGDALKHIIGLEDNLFSKAIDKLVGHSLISVSHIDNAEFSTYTMHHLVRSYVKAHGENNPISLAKLRSSWINWYVELADEVRSSWATPEKLAILEPEKEALFDAIHWALSAGEHHKVFALVRGVRYFYFSYGFWDLRLEIDRAHFQAARREGDVTEEIKALSHFLYLACRRRELENLQHEIDRLNHLIQLTPQLNDSVASLSKQTLAVIEMVQGNYDTAIDLYRRSAHKSDNRLNVAWKRWSSRCYIAQGRFEEAKKQLLESLALAIQEGFVRSQTFHQLDLAKVSINLAQFDDAKNRLYAAHKLIGVFPSPIVETEYMFLTGWLAAKTSNLNQGIQKVKNAVQKFERLSMRQEVEEARQVLSQLLESPIN